MSPTIRVHLRFGTEALPHAKGAAANVAVAEVEFVTGDGRPFGASEHWFRLDKVVGAIATCLAGLPREGERLVVSLSAAIGQDEVLIGHQQVNLRPQDSAYLRFALSHETGAYAFLAYGDEDNRVSELIVETEREWLDEIVSLGWGWHSFRGYLMQGPDADLLRDLVGRRDAELRRRRELERAICVFEDWADGTALRISSLRLSEPQLAARINIKSIQSVLDQIDGCQG